MPAQRSRYLAKRGSVFWFRMAVPRDLKSRLAFREFSVSLKTSDPIAANQRCLRVAANVLQLIAMLQSTMKPLSPEFIRELAKSHLAKEREMVASLALDIPHDRNIDVAFEAQQALDETVSLRSKIMSRPFDALTRSIAATALAEKGFPPKSVRADDFDQLCHGIVRAQIEGLRIYAATLNGRFDQCEPIDPIFKTSAQQSETPVSIRTVGALVEAYKTYKTSEWVPKTAADNGRALQYFCLAVGGDLPAHRLSAEELRLFREFLLKLPGSAGRKKTSEIVDSFKMGTAATSRLNDSTLDKYWQFARSFLKWCVKQEFLPKMPGQAIDGFSISQTQIKEARASFSPEALQKLFSSPVYSGCKSAKRRSDPGELVIRDGKFWIPLIAVFSGMRLGEIVQLLVADIKTENGVSYFDVSRTRGKAINN